MVNSTEIPDHLAAHFTYHPYAARFRILDPSTGTQTASESESFSIVSIHLRPESVIEEIVALEQVARWVAGRWAPYQVNGSPDRPLVGSVPPYSDTGSDGLDLMRNTTLGIHCSGGAGNVIVLGDFNADCSYVRASEWPAIALRNREDLYHWLIGDDADTNVASGSSCAYDRIVATNAVLPRLNQSTARVHRFDLALNLTDDLARRVSDHYPVAVDWLPIGSVNSS